jgi:radical SAM superfamily enzyme
MQEAWIFSKNTRSEILAYFQAYTNTYGSFENLKRKYESSTLPDVYGIVIAPVRLCEH